MSFIKTINRFIVNFEKQWRGACDVARYGGARRGVSGAQREGKYAELADAELAKICEMADDARKVVSILDEAVKVRPDLLSCGNDEIIARFRKAFK